MAGVVLLAEHDPAVREMLRRYLIRDGLSVRLASAADQALAALAAPPWLAVLDLTMPDLDPRRLRQALRGRPAMPAVFLVAPGPRPRGLAGPRTARRWLTRPFGPRLLIATVTELARGCEVHAGDPHRAVLAGGRLVRLTATEHAFLAALLAATGRPLSRARLRAVAGSDAGDRAVDVHIAQLRAKLGGPAVIRTVRGAGFAIEPVTDIGFPGSGAPAERGQTLALASGDGPAEGAVAGPLG